MDTRTLPEKVRHAGHLEALITRLRQGDATALDLVLVAGVNFRARVSDARKNGWDIECTRTASGNVYHLKGRFPQTQLGLGL